MTGTVEADARAGLSTVELDRVREWLDAEGVESGNLKDVEAIGGGTQNRLVGFSRGGQRLVLRMPPRHAQPHHDKTMLREIRILKALADTDVPHARVRAACTDPAVLGSVFYVQDRIEGFSPADSLPGRYRSDLDLQFEMGRAIVEALTTIGRVDVSTDSFAGLGNPDGWLDRQVDRWHRQLHGYESFAGYEGGSLPGAETIAHWLTENRPTQWQPGLMHGDYHAANVMVDTEEPRVSAVVDWELATVGDPLIDLAHLVITWPSLDTTTGRDIVSAKGLPTARELVTRYTDGTSRDMSQFGWYLILARFRLGVLLEGTRARACAGEASTSTGDRLHGHAVRLFSAALESVEHGEGRL